MIANNDDYKSFLDSQDENIIKLTILFRSNISSSGILNLQKFNLLQYLRCSCLAIREIIYLPNTLKKLDCHDNRIVSLPPLPNSLIELDCDSNYIKELPMLPSNLEILQCGYNKLTYLPKLPNSITYLSVQNNRLVSLPKLPNKLKTLFCNNNELTIIPYIPLTLQILSCSDNQLTQINIYHKHLLSFYNYNTNIINSSIRRNLYVRFNFVDNQFVIYPDTNLDTIIIINNFRKIYFTLKYGPRFKKYFWNSIKKRKYDLHLELLYSPNLPFYKQFWNSQILQYI
jgi:Leucine-rich repeat (LRR) protein